MNPETEKPKFNGETLAAIREADEIAKDKSGNRYATANKLFGDISEELNPETNNHE